MCDLSEDLLLCDLVPEVFDLMFNLNRDGRSLASAA